MVIDIVDERMNVRVSASEIARAFFARAARGPGFGGPVGTLDDADEIHQLSAAQGIGDDVPSWANPVDTGLPREMFGMSSSNFVIYRWR
jgi:hypothetical protein